MLGSWLIDTYITCSYMPTPEPATISVRIVVGGLIPFWERWNRWHWTIKEWGHSRHHWGLTLDPLSVMGVLIRLYFMSCQRNKMGWRLKAEGNVLVLKHQSINTLCKKTSLDFVPIAFLRETGPRAGKWLLAPPPWDIYITFLGK